MRAHRREFLRFLAASPLLAQASQSQDVLSISDLEELCHKALPPAHWGYLATGVDDDKTLKANIGAFGHIGLRPRRLVDVSKIDTGVEVLGERWASPLFLCPVGAQKAFHAEGEVATGRTAKAGVRRRSFPPRLRDRSKMWRKAWAARPGISCIFRRSGTRQSV